jgi:hypothetical protein
MKEMMIKMLNPTTWLSELLKSREEIKLSIKDLSAVISK